MKTEDYLLTTVDNKFNPFVQYDAWEREDHRLGYDTPIVMARLGAFSNDMPYDEYEAEYDDVANRMINMLPAVYTKVYRNKK
jgi:hypothetical protein